MKYLAKIKDNLVINYVKNEEKYISFMIKKGVDFSNWIKTDFDFNQAKQYKYEDNNFIEISKDEIDKKDILLTIVNKIENEAKEIIQTVSADKRSSILATKKQKGKFYQSTWQNFYQKCQNIIFSEKSTKKAKNDALFVIERIEKITIKKREIIKELENMNLEQLKSFNNSNSKIWKI